MVREELIIKGTQAKEASNVIAQASATEKNKALSEMAQALVDNIKEIIEANSVDLENAKNQDLPKAFMDRLTLNEVRIREMAQGLTELIALPDPIRESSLGWVSEDGIEIRKVQVPLGVIGIIYEARPNVTSDAAGLCLKAGNAVILRGSKDAINSNKKIVEVLQNALEKTTLGKYVIQLVEDTSREAANEMMQMNKYIDVLIPRGGQGLINSVVENSRIPVIETGTGNCHAFVDETADIEMAVRIIENGKTQRPGVCNALETVLVHKNIAEKLLPALEDVLNKYPVELRVCEESKKYLKKYKEATEDDYYTEFLDLILAVKIVDSIDDAISHIYKYSSKHSEVIITKDYNNGRKFQKEVDAAAVYVNASTRFTDGGKFGFGAEIGISTQKLHARGPMGIKHLTSYKYEISGNGEIR
ncbi:MAG: glutamate-5-semialdehyde dehydrogenase [Eubacteriales bacterium]|nr:glutamate-5-semialdehyde dehydrogenase [Eubacteriales bacterium]NCC81248.1 glutamate-5-semialdehyde dehydrogenase [Clostridia bacterium]